MKLEDLVKFIPSESILRAIRSSLMTRFADLSLRDKKRNEFELRRKQRVEPHRVLFFFQSNDPYSTLAAQFLHQIQASYAVKLRGINPAASWYKFGILERTIFRKYLV